MRLNLASLKEDVGGYLERGVALPCYDVEQMRQETLASPEWVHFGAGNIFRGFIASIAQKLLDRDLVKTGIIVCETFDYDIVDKIYEPCDNLVLNVLMNADGTTSREVSASIAEAVKADFAGGASYERLKHVFSSPSLKMVSFTITEKGYQLKGADGAFLPSVKADMEQGPAAARHAMSVLASLLLARFAAHARPIAVVSMDNCSHNGAKLKDAVLTIAESWVRAGFASSAFIGYLSDESSVSFPWTMIDKITPRPHKVVHEALLADGFEDIDPVITSRGTFIAPFVNAERAEYLVIEDSFPNGRPALEKAGVYMTDRETVNKTERMKVTTCLNPLHTAMSMYGCLLGYTLICKEMDDPDIVRLVRTLGYVEGLPVVVDPGILSPKSFIDEVVEERLPNRFMPDDPRRIATDTSQKVAVRFGETVKSYIAQGRTLDSLVAIPMALAGWMRYLLAVDDEGCRMEVSADPLKDELQRSLAGIVWNDAGSYNGQLRAIFSNASIFGLDVTSTALFAKIEDYFIRLLEGPGAVRRLLRQIP